MVVKAASRFLTTLRAVIETESFSIPILVLSAGSI